MSDLSFKTELKRPPNYKGLVFAGGGLMGFAYIGCLRMLEEYKIIGQNIEFLAGCSIGAVFAAIISIGYSSSELYDFVINFEYDIIKDLNFIGFMENYGVETGNKITEFIRIMIKRKTGHRKCNFHGFVQNDQTAFNH